MKDFAFVFDFIMPHHHHTDKMFPRPCLYICTICLFVVEFNRFSFRHRTSKDIFQIVLDEATTAWGIKVERVEM